MRFKPYNQNQKSLFLPSFDELIPNNHPVRVVDAVIEQLDIKPLLREYHDTGKPGYHPKMMLKIMVYAYMNNTYSTRKIEQAMRENVNFMWLADMQVADHNTIARFRVNKLQKAFKDIFKQVVLLLAEEGLVTLKEVYTDGTKIEAQAGRYTFVWGKAIKNRKEKMNQQLEQLWQYAQNIADHEDSQPDPPDFTTPISKEKIEKTVEQIDEKLSDNPSVSKKAKAKLRYVKKNFASNLDKYAEQEKILAGRNSYSKTDTDATFMRMKEDHMNNGQLKPAYNVQISTENQVIVHYSLHQNPTDTKTLKPHLASFAQLYNRLPEDITADAGYGSHENYDYLDQMGITAYVKYNYFNQEQKLTRARKKKIRFAKNELYYNENLDYYVCPMGQKMHRRTTKTRMTDAGYEQQIAVYQAQNCTACPLKWACHSAKGNRKIERNHELERYKQRARELLLSEQGVKKRKKRTADVEPIFAYLKHNRNFKRFTLRTIEKAELEFGLHAIAHNLKKFTV